MGLRSLLGKSDEVPLRMQWENSGSHHCILRISQMLNVSSIMKN